MTKPAHIRLSDLRGFQRLANDATVGLTDLVEAMHHTITRTPLIFGAAPSGTTTGITGLVYKSVRGVTRLVGVGVDALLGRIAPLVAARASSKEREALLAALNGVLGDYLVASANPLAIPMHMRSAGTPLTIERATLAKAFPGAGGQILVMVHGLCMNDLQWTRNGWNHGEALARELGYTSVYLHYNSGRHVSTNGREFADLLEALVREWPVPVEELAIVGHSMGGLVARSACHCADLAGHHWRKRLDRLVFLGTPHHGAPAERAGAWADFVIELSPYTAPFARLGKVRSAGIKDLRHGFMLDEDWQRPRSHAGHTALPLPADVRCYAIAASRQARPAASGTSIRGDGLVPVNSALGRHRETARDLKLPAARQWVAHGTGHFELLERADVYARVRKWLSED
jgi:pimeloyl-ACP methyl ester carboxylesterase